MRRREFLRALTSGIIVLGFAPGKALAGLSKPATLPCQENFDDYIKDYLHKMKNFDKYHKSDICLKPQDYKILKSSVRRLNRLRLTVGHANFHLLDFDTAIRTARNYPNVGRFSKTELCFLEKSFYEDAAKYGFYGEKPMNKLTEHISTKDVVKIPHSGNYLYRGAPLERYKQVRKAIGEKAILTSGVRSVIKQFLLFLSKAYKHKGNLSLASRSLAPPGYSFHGIGDFDIGQANFGYANFTERFITTEVFKKLEDLGFLTLRYSTNNKLGVRFEPWHIKIS